MNYERWPDDCSEKVMEMNANGLSAREIADAIGLTRNAVLGKIFRLKKYGPPKKIHKPTTKVVKEPIVRHPGAWRSEANKLRDKMPVAEIAAKLGLRPSDISQYFDKSRDSEITLITGESAFVRPHVYRTPRRIDMGPVVAAALAALEARQCRGR